MRSKSSWILVSLLFFAAIINYIDRGSLSVAAPRVAADLALSPVELGFVLSSFFWSYTAFQMLSGWLADRFPVIWVFSIGLLIWSLATIASGFAQSLVSLALLRFVLGAGESVAFPCYSKVIAAGFPMAQRGLPNSVIEAGTKLGPALGTLVGALLMAKYGWHLMFIALGIVSLSWLVPWFIWTPASQPQVAREGGSTGPSLLQIAARKDAWGTFIGNFCYTYGYYFLLTWLPSYLVNERHVSIELMGVLGSVPFWGSAATAVVCGWLSDRWIKRGGSATRVRKTFIVGGFCMSILMVPAAVVPNLRMSMVLLSLAYAGFGMYASNHWAITQTLAGPIAAGKWTGLQNTVGSLSGIIAPIATGMLVQRTGSFLWAFISPALLALVGVCCYLWLVGEVQPVQWNHSAEGM